MSKDKLEAYARLTIHDYEFLKGNTVYWPHWGAAFGIVSKWCKNKGFGEFGEPTEQGKKAMEYYERTNLGLC